MTDVTHILNAIEQSDTGAVDKLFPAVYNELRGLAAQKTPREALGQTLQAIALVHEAYLRLVGVVEQTWGLVARRAICLAIAASAQL